MTLWLGQSGTPESLDWLLYLHSYFIRSHAASKIKSNHCVELLFVSSRCFVDRAAQIVNSIFVRVGPGVGRKLLGLDRGMGVRKFCEKFLDPYLAILRM
jgi:hypothetical protein